MGKGPNIKNISKNALSDGFLVNPRPLYNSNMAKVSIVKWSQKWIFVYGSAISGIPKYFAVFNAISKSGVGPKKGVPSTKINF